MFMDSIKLDRKNWNKDSIIDFENYLYSIRNEEKIEWTTRIVNTKLQVLAITSPVIKNIAKEICKGNYLEFLGHNGHKYYESTLINGYIINQIKDFALWQKYIFDYINNIDNWATCDILKFNKKWDKEILFNFAESLTRSTEEFKIRVGLRIMFNLIETVYLQKIFTLINNLETNNQYYVNMMISWLLCECFIKRRNETLKYLKTNNLNSFVIRKFVSKCRDSYRVSKQDKDELLKLKNRKEVKI